MPTREFFSDTDMKIKSNLIPLIDGDLLVYRIGFAADSQAKKEIGEERLTYDYLGLATTIMKTFVADIGKTFEDAPTMQIYLSGPTNFRDSIATILPYKGNRDPNNRPKYYKELKQELISLGAVITEGIEADDALGIEQYRRKDRSSVIVSADKDLKMIPGYHYNPVNGEFTNVKLVDANLAFFRQMLVGDKATDNIPGIEGIGPVRAALLFPDGTDVTHAAPIIAEAYRQQYPENPESAIEEIANLLWIQRKENERCPFIQEFQAQVNGQEQMEAAAQIANAKKRIRKASRIVSRREED